MSIRAWFTKLLGLAPKVISRRESFSEFFTRLVTQPLEDLKCEEQSVKSYFVTDPLSSMCTLSAFGADVISPYVNPDFGNNTKSHYFNGYSGNRMPKVLFNKHKDELVHSLLEAIPDLPHSNYIGEYEGDYKTLENMVIAVRPMFPMMYYASPDVEENLAKYIRVIYFVLYQIHTGRIKDRSHLSAYMQEVYLHATDLMFPLSIKGYSILLSSLPPELQARMVSVKVKTRLTIQKQYSRPKPREIKYAI